MESPRGRLLWIFILVCLFSDIARPLENDDNPSDFKALGILRREKDSTKVKEILPVEVNVGGLVNFFNAQIQKLGDNVTHLNNQLQIIKENEERNRESLKAELERSRNKSKLLEEEAERCRIESKLLLEEEVERNNAAQNSLKEEIYRLKNESTAIKAENERLKMTLEATTHETGILQGTTSRPKAIVYKENDKVRITKNGSPASEGLLEVFHDGEWGTVCHDWFGDVDATVVCRMLGYATGTSRCCGAFGRGSGRIWLDLVHCNGDELSIFDCEARPLGENDCAHSQDVGVSCTGQKTDGRLYL